MVLIDLGEDANFVHKHPYFFENFTCKFEGWEPHLQRVFENIIKDMGGKIADNATCIFTEHIYSIARQDRNYDYSINYLTQSIETEGRNLDLEKWRYINLEARGNPVGLGCCCNDIRYILSARGSYSDNFNSIVCTQCLRNPISYPNEIDREFDPSEDCNDLQVHNNNNSAISKSNQKSQTGNNSIDKWKRKEPIIMSDLDISSENFNEEWSGDEEIIGNNGPRIPENQELATGIRSIDRWKRKEPISIRDLDTSSGDSSDESHDQVTYLNAFKFVKLKCQKPEASPGQRKEQINIEDLDISSKSSSHKSCTNSIVIEGGTNSIHKHIRKQPRNLSRLSDTSSESSGEESQNRARSFRALHFSLKKRLTRSVVRKTTDKNNPKADKPLPTNDKTKEIKKNLSTKETAEVISIKNNYKNVSKVLNSQNSKSGVSNVDTRKRKQPKSFSDTSSESSGEQLPSIASTFREFHSTLNIRHSEKSVDKTTTKVDKSISTSKKTSEVKKSTSTSKKTKDVEKYLSTKGSPKVDKIMSINKKSAGAETITSARKKSKEVEKSLSKKETSKIDKTVPKKHKNLIFEETASANKKTKEVHKKSSTKESPEVELIIPTKKIDSNVSTTSKTQNSKADVGNSHKRKRKQPKSFSDSSSESSSDQLQSIASTFREFHDTIRKKHKKSDAQKSDKTTPIVDKIISTKETPDIEVVLSQKKAVEVVTLDSQEPVVPCGPRKLMKDIKEWWINLPPGAKPDPNYKEKEYKFLAPDRDFVDNEERTMIAYLVKNNLYDEFDKRSTWRRMHRDGYLRPRSIDSLKKQIKVTLSHIEFFNLPEEIERRFLSISK